MKPFIKIILCSFIVSTLLLNSCSSVKKLAVSLDQATKNLKLAAKAIDPIKIDNIWNELYLERAKSQALVRELDGIEKADFIRRAEANKLIGYAIYFSFKPLAKDAHSHKWFVDIQNKDENWERIHSFNSYWPNGSPDLTNYLKDLKYKSNEYNYIQPIGTTDFFKVEKSMEYVDNDSLEVLNYLPIKIRISGQTLHVLNAKAIILRRLPGGTYESISTLSLAAKEKKEHVQILAHPLMNLILDTKMLEQIAKKHDLSVSKLY